MACSECGQHYGNAQPCRDLAEAVKGRSSPSPTETQDTAGKDKKKSKASKEDDWINLKGVILPSAKTRAAKAQILNWIEEDKDVKIVVYTQFLPMIRILEKVCIAERWSFSKYAGNMSHDARAASLAEFSSLEKNKRILLASLRAGGLGLNVTAANKVLLLDPWWNSAVSKV